MDTVLVIITILGGVAAIWYFWEKLTTLINDGNDANQHDIELFEKYKALFINNGAAEFYRQHDFLGSFETTYWKPLSRYVDTWDTVEHEFVDSRLKKSHMKVYASAYNLGMAIAKNTVLIGKEGYLRSVKPDNLPPGPTPEYIKNEAKEINMLVPNFVKAHQLFVRIANRKLRRRSVRNSVNKNPWHKEPVILGAIISGLFVVAAAIIGGLFLFATQNQSSIDDKPSSLFEDKTEELIDRHTDPVIQPKNTAREDVDPGADTAPSSQNEFAAVSDPNYHPITLDEYFSTRYEGGLTGLQIDEFEAGLLNKRVVWEGTVDKISSDSDGKIDIRLEPSDGSYGTAFLEFEPKHRPLLLNTNEGQKLRVSCIIRNFVASPFLKKCSIIRVLK